MSAHHTPLPRAFSPGIFIPILPLAIRSKAHIRDNNSFTFQKAWHSSARMPGPLFYLLCKTF